MKRIIDIPEYVIDDMKECGFIPEEDNEELCKAIDNGTPIPDNATNGDVIKAIFDVTEEHFYDEDKMVDVYGLDRTDEPSTFYADWWNSPYQKGGKERDYDVERRNHSKMILNAQKGGKE